VHNTCFPCHATVKARDFVFNRYSPWRPRRGAFRARYQSRRDCGVDAWIHEGV